jgi:hypothetical protein
MWSLPRLEASTEFRLRRAVRKMDNWSGVTSHNSAYVHRRLRGRLGLHGAAARRSATWPLALVGLGATSHTCDTLCEMAKGAP